MQLHDIMATLGARLISSHCNPTTEVRAGFAADLMSDALRYDLSQALLVSGLANHQVVRTAEMADVVAILMVRGKIPAADTLDLAQEIGIPFFSTELTMFESCGRLFHAGLPACKRFNSD